MTPPTVGAMVAEVTRLLGGRIWRGSNESEIQEAMAPVLVHGLMNPAAGEDLRVSVTREFWLTDADRVDFMLNVLGQPPEARSRIALEVKVKGSTVEVARQLQRYAQAPYVGAVILATTTPRLALALRGATLGELPIFTITLRRF